MNAAQRRTLIRKKTKECINRKKAITALIMLGFMQEDEYWGNHTQEYRYWDVYVLKEKHNNVNIYLQFDDLSDQIYLYSFNEQLTERKWNNLNIIERVTELINDQTAMYSNTKNTSLQTS